MFQVWNFDFWLSNAQKNGARDWDLFVIWEGNAQGNGAQFCYLEFCRNERNSFRLNFHAIFLRIFITPGLTYTSQIFLDFDDKPDFSDLGPGRKLRFFVVFQIRQFAKLNRFQQVIQFGPRGPEYAVLAHQLFRGGGCVVVRENPEAKLS